MAVKKAPLNIFKKTVQYFPTFSVNIVLLNKNKDFLLVKRKVNPAKGLYLPGGRMLNGETVRQCTERMLKEELGVKGKIKYISPRYVEEIWPVKYFKGDRGPYTKETKNVHYICTIAVVELGKNEKIKLDYQSQEHIWLKKLPAKPLLLHSCFSIVKDYLREVYSVDI
jgi:8-oxo-dGTP pyrophosphatase MutT (NUDIX family)